MSLTIAGALLDGQTAGLRVEDGLIAEIGPSVVARAGDEVIDAEGLLLSPPMVNGHTHAAMTLFRGFGDDMPLMEWLQRKIWPAEAKLQPDDVYWGTRLACLEMIRSGTTRFFDMYWHPEATARAVVDAGIRATIGAPMFDKGRDAKGAQAESREFLEKLAAIGGPITAALAPH